MGRPEPLEGQIYPQLRLRLGLVGRLIGPLFMLILLIVGLTHLPQRDMG